MDKRYWQQRWEANEIGFNQSQPNQLMQRYFSRLNLKSGARVFVPLCGKSIDMLWLAVQGYRVIGVELSQYACQAFFTENEISFKIIEVSDFVIYAGDNITLFAGDFFKLDKSLLEKIDAVYDRAALIALPPAVRPLYAVQLTQLLEPEAAVFLITTAYDQNEMQGPPFSVDQAEVDLLFQKSFTIDKFYSKPMREISPHLKAKGLMYATEEGYLLKQASESD